jgi:hypothetical protein
VAVCLAALLVPATAPARTPASGGFKQHLVQVAASGHLADTAQLIVSPTQARTCFSVWTYHGFAYVDPYSGYIRRYPRRSLCSIQARYSGRISDWQPVNIIEHNTRGRWGVRTEYDEMEPQQLRQLRIPLSVFENLTHSKPLAPSALAVGAMEAASDVGMDQP